MFLRPLGEGSLIAVVRLCITLNNLRTHTLALYINTRALTYHITRMHIHITHLHMHTYTQCTYTQCTYTHTHTCTHTQHIHIHMHTHAHTHTHTHAQELGDCCSIAFVHTNHDTSETVLNHLLVQWHSPHGVSITHTFPSSLIGYTHAMASKLALRNGCIQSIGYISQGQSDPALDPALGTPLRGMAFGSVCYTVRYIPVLPLQL